MRIFQHYLKLFQTQKPCDTIPNLLMRTVQRIGLTGTKLMCAKAEPAGGGAGISCASLLSVPLGQHHGFAVCHAAPKPASGFRKLGERSADMVCPQYHKLAGAGEKALKLGLLGRGKGTEALTV